MRLKIIFILIPMLVLSGCTGCSKSGRVVRINKSKASYIPVKEEVTRKSTPPDTSSDITTASNIIKMRERQGVYTVPVEVNGVAMEFIFDTGASDIVLSSAEAMFLYRNGKLSIDDIHGTRRYQIADGTIAEGTLINLRTVKIGNKVLENVEASVVKNLEAPLLIGQSALNRFGRITIDYKRLEIGFE
jgi:aspartyl protease family protein